METQNASWVLMFCASGPFPSQGRVCGAQGSKKRYVHICWCMSIDYTMKTHTIDCQCQSRGTLRTNQSRQKATTKQHATDDSAQKRWKMCLSCTLYAQGRSRCQTRVVGQKTRVYHSSCPQDAHLLRQIHTRSYKINHTMILRSPDRLKAAESDLVASLVKAVFRWRKLPSEW
jgi:hypothetical protein